MGLKGQTLLIQFIDTVIGTDALVRIAASAWKHHRYVGEEIHARRLQPVNESSSFNPLPPSFHPYVTTHVAICVAHSELEK